MSITDLSIKKLSGLFDAKKISFGEAALEYLNEIEKRDGALHAYISVLKESALKHAATLDARRPSEDEKTSLTGIPMAIKDNICTKGVLTTCASQMLEGFIPTYNATASERLSDCVLLGKTNLDEFAMGFDTSTSYFFRTVNPFDFSRSCGGSSGGSAAAVAANEACFALGSDTGGSVRQPAAYCGVIGLKPTYGLISRFGLIAYSSSLDCIGILCRTPNDAAIVLNRVSGRDGFDSTSVERSTEDYSVEIKKCVSGMKIAVPREYFDYGIEKDVYDDVKAVCAAYESMGVKIEEVSVTPPEILLSAYRIIAYSEACSNLARYDGIHCGKIPDGKCGDIYTETRTRFFGSEVKRRITEGAYILSTRSENRLLDRAIYQKKAVEAEFDDIFEKYDAILSPTVPSRAFVFGEEQKYSTDAFTVAANLAGIPAVSVPCKSRAGFLPCGFQLMGKKHSESLLLRLANAYCGYIGENADE